MAIFWKQYIFAAELRSLSLVLMVEDYINLTVETAVSVLTWRTKGTSIGE